MFTTRLDALSIAFRVAGFGRADLTLFPEMKVPHHANDERPCDLPVVKVLLSIRPNHECSA